MAGIVIPVAQGPNRNEMTGPTIVDDTLFVAVQHPGEDTPIRETAAENQSRSIQILEGDGPVQDTSFAPARPRRSSRRRKSTQKVSACEAPIANAESLTAATVAGPIWTATLGRPKSAVASKSAA
jgi:secreted PhoX family phosphatase